MNSFILEETETYRLHKNGEQQYLSFPKLDDYEELRHLFTTRHGGVSSGDCGSWNFGARKLDREGNIRENFRRLARVLDIDVEQMVLTDQTHTCNIKEAALEDGGKGIAGPKDYEDIDGLVTNQRGLALITTHADCNAIFFFDPVKQVIGLAHSGWRGTLGGIGGAMVERMQELYGCDTRHVIAGIGPSLCQQCFEVDADVADAFFKKNTHYKTFATQRGIKYYIDLKKIIFQDLLAEGLLHENLLDMKLCTKCNMDLFFSHRGQKGRRGLMAAAMMLV